MFFKNISCNGNSLPFGDLAATIQEYEQASGKPVWLTEIGHNTPDQQWQGEYLKRVVNVSSRLGVPMVNVYGWSDKMKGDYDGSNYGLYTISNTIKTSGEVFSDLSRL